jgi:hypothetical protein
MEELKQYLPVITILGPIIGALIGAAVTLSFVVKRKRVTFYVYRTEDLIRDLRQNLAVVVLRLNNQDVTELNRAQIWVRNNGNAAIKDFRFEIMIPGDHALRLADKHANDAVLHQEIKIDWDKSASTYNHRFAIQVPYFNPKETFSISVFFDNSPDNVEVLCRMQDVKCVTRDADYIYSNTFGAAVLRGLLKGLANETPFVRGVFR